MLATSRSKLNLSGETVLVLGGLETTWTTPEEAIQKSGVRLFIDACKRANPSFSLNTDDLDSLAQILFTTGGIPLGIVLAAAWTDMLSIREISEEIAKSLDFLETEMEDVPDRHRSVRAVFEYSWDLLSDEERVVFSALAVFRGGFTREAASQVSGASIRHLATLANKSLLTANPDTGRYTIHELLRQYAETELQADEERANSIQDAHGGFYADLMDQAYDLFPVADHIEMMRIMEDDLDNIRAAWRRLVAARDAKSVRTMLPPVQVLYELRSRYPSGVAFLQEAIDVFAKATDQESQVVVALATNIQAWFLALLGQPNAEKPRGASAVLRGSDDTFAQWLGLQGEALNHSYLGLGDEMTKVADEAMAKAVELGDDFWISGAKNWRSLAAILEQDFENASRLLAEALTVFEARNDHYFITWTLLLQANLANAQERPEAAIALYTRQAEVCKAIGYPRGTMLALEGLGKANVVTGDLGSARKAFTEAAAVAERTSMIPDLLGLMAKLGNVRGLMGDVEGAVELLSTVVSDPQSQGHTASDPRTATELASEPLERFRQELDPESFESARVRGSARSYDVALRDLLAANQ